MPLESCNFNEVLPLRQTDVLKPFGVDLPNFDRDVMLATEKMIPKLLPVRDEHSDKRGQGTALVIAGSKNMPGAAALCTEAALRSGAGLVTLACAESIAPILQTKLSEPVFAPIEELSLNAIQHLLPPQKAMAIGPGLGTAENTSKAVREILSAVSIPTVIDADAINAIDKEFLKTLKKQSAQEQQARFILTPHLREFQRNFSKLPEQLKDYPEFLRKISAEIGQVIVLKASPIWIAIPDGRIYTVQAENSGMAKGGSGDVLTGILVALLSAGMNLPEAAVLGVLLHQKAGRITREELGSFSMLPSDVIRNLHKAFR